MIPEPAPPYRPGARVRAEWREATLRQAGYRWVFVDWELGAGYRPWPLRAEDLGPADAWRGDAGE